MARLYKGGEEVMRKDLPYDRDVLISNVRILVRMRGVLWKQVGVPYGVIDSSKSDRDISLSNLVKIAKKLDVSLDTLVFKDLEKEINTIITKEISYGDDSSRTDESHCEEVEEHR